MIKLSKKLSEINETLIEGFADSVETILGMIGLGAFFLLFVSIFSCLGGFYRQNYNEGIRFFLLSVLAYYTGKGIGRYLEKKNERG